MASSDFWKRTILLYSWTFTLLNRDCHWLILGHMALTKIKCIPIVINQVMYPARDTLHVIKAWWKVAWQKAGKTVPVFFFANEPNNTNMKPQAKKQQLLDEVFVISRIIKVEVGVISRSRRLRLITLTETLIILDITKTESDNCFIIHWMNPFFLASTENVFRLCANSFFSSGSRGFFAFT